MSAPGSTTDMDGKEEPESDGLKETFDRIFSETYEELRRLAYAVKHSYASATLNPTALVDEAYVKLSRSPEVAGTSKLHFKRIAARAMRQILIESARRRNAQKRGGGETILLPLSDSSQQVASDDDSLLAIDAALQELARLNPRQAAMVEYRFFAGFELAEVASLLGISEATVLRDWRVARAWLAHEIRREI